MRTTAIATALVMFGATEAHSSAYLVVLAGFGFAAKYTAVVAVPYALGFVGWKLIRARRPFVRPR